MTPPPTNDHQYVIFIGDGDWRIGYDYVEAAVITSVDMSDCDDLASRVAALYAALNEHAPFDQSVLIALPSDWCLAATITTDDLTTRGRPARRQEMNFKLEEHVPVSAEDFIADYVEHGSEALGVCCEFARLQELIDAFESAGIPVQRIVPTALLIAGEHERTQSDDMIAITTANEFEVIERRTGRPLRWSWFADDLDATIDHITNWIADPGTQDFAVFDEVESGSIDIADYQLPGGGEVLRSHLTHRCDSVEGLQSNLDVIATTVGAEILRGNASPTIDFRRDRLAAPEQFDKYRKPVMFLVASLIVLFITVIIVGQVRGRRYAGLARDYVDQQVEIFESTFPIQRVPGNIRARLQSEQRKLAGLGGQTTDADAATSTSALIHLHDILANLPKGLRFRILDISIEPELIRIDGEARSHAEAERIAITLRQSKRFNVDAPRTQSLRGGGVSFVFVAKLKADDGAKP